MIGHASYSFGCRRFTLSSLIFFILVVQFYHMILIFCNIAHFLEQINMSTFNKSNRKLTWKKEVSRGHIMLFGILNCNWTVVMLCIHNPEVHIQMEKQPFNFILFNMRHCKSFKLHLDHMQYWNAVYTIVVSIQMLHKLFPVPENQQKRIQISLCFWSCVH